MATENYDASLAHLNKSAAGMRFGLVVSQWNSDITSSMSQAAQATLIQAGASEEDIITQQVPGSFELIYGCSRMMEKRRDLDAIIAIGSVIRGETAHFDHVCSATAQGIARLNERASIPVLFCVLTDENKQQAIDRSGGRLGNKGTEAAVAAVEMAVLRKDLS